VDMRLEVVVIPVADVDRAKDFYKALGWREDADYAADADFRVVQLTPPGSACSLIFGTGLTSAAPGSAEGLHLVVPDIEGARAELIDRGADVSEVFHDAGGVSTTPGPRPACRGRPRTTRATAPLPRSATRTATAGCSRRSPPACRAANRGPAGTMTGGPAGRPAGWPAGGQVSWPPVGPAIPVVTKERDPWQ
jgi:catechol 2,3-dioxygenase-like lactoylglutathione lyase family enzyme